MSDRHEDNRFETREDYLHAARAAEMDGHLDEKAEILTECERRFGRIRQEDDELEGMPEPTSADPTSADADPAASESGSETAPSGDGSPTGADPASDLARRLFGDNVEWPTASNPGEGHDPRDIPKSAASGIDFDAASVEAQRALAELAAPAHGMWGVEIARADNN